MILQYIIFIDFCRHSMDAAICLWLVYIDNEYKTPRSLDEYKTRSRVFTSTSRIGTILNMWLNDLMSNMLETTWLPVDDVNC